MKKRMLSLLIALCMALSLMPVTAFADDGTATVAQVGDTAYATLAAAVDAVDEDNGTIVVLNDVTENVTVPAGKTVALDLNGKTISGQVISQGDLTILDSTADKEPVVNDDFTVETYESGKITYSSSAVAARDGGKVTLENGTVESTHNLGVVAFGDQTGNTVITSTVTVNGGYIITPEGSGAALGNGSVLNINGGVLVTTDNAVLSGNGTVDKTQDLGGVTINVTGGTMIGHIKTSGYIACGIYFPNDTTLNISGGTIYADGGVGVCMRAGTANITGGEIIASGNATGKVGDAKNTVGSYGLVFDRSAKYPARTNEDVANISDDAKISGGLLVMEDPDEEGQFINVKGGYFNDLASAVTYAADKAEIKLLDDVTVSSKIAIAGKSITIDLNGHTITGQQTRDDGTYGVRIFNVNNDAELLLTGKGVVTTPDANGTYFPDNDAVIVVDSNPSGNIKGNAKLTIDKDVKVVAPASYGVTIFGCNNENAKPTIVVRGEVTAEASALSGNGTYSVVDIIVEDTAKLTSTESPCIYFPADGNLTINGGSITGVGGIEVKAGTTVVSISGDPYITATGTPSHEANGNGNSSVGYAIAAVENDGYGGNASVTIENGHYHGPIGVLIDNETERHSMISISGGYFTEDPSEYCVEDKTGVASDDANYPYTVGDKGATPAEVEAVVVPADVADNASQAAKDAAAAMDGAVVEQNNNLEAAVKDEANKNDITADTKLEDGSSVTEALNGLEAIDDVSDENPVVIVYQPYIDVKVADAEAEGTGDDITYTSVKVEMTPMYRVIATTKDVYENEYTDYYTEGDEQNAIIVEEAKELDLADKEYDVTVFLPGEFATEGEKLSVKHEKDNGSVEYYTGTYHLPSASPYVEFTTKGFSPFTIYAASESAAEVDGVIYPSLQAAVDAVKNNGTIKLLKDVAADEKATVSKTISFKVDTNKEDGTKYTFDSEKNLVAGNRTTVAVSESAAGSGIYAYQFTYTPSSGSGSTSSYYTVTVASTKNGTVSASTKSAAKDEVVTVTVKADNGYELDKLTVTDANGNELKLTDKGDGKYTFVMPKSKVTVTATFALADENPIFDDIDKDAYYYDAIKWAVANGVTNGMSTTEFVPDGPCTRGQIVTFLWRAAGKPAPTTTNNPFVDVNEKDYYYEAVLWAVENGITNGMSETEFMPELTCTRAHGVTFLYRAMGKAVDAKAEFSDVPADAYYAQAVAWAAANGVTNGVSEELFAPDNACTRVQIVTFLYRANLIK